MPTHQGDVNANLLMNSLTDGVDFPILEVDFNSDDFKLPDDFNGDIRKAISRLKNEDLSSGAVGGSGTFDVLMGGFKVHLAEEYDKGRISGAEYTKAYVALTAGAMSNAVQFLLGRDGAYWQAVLGQTQAITARISMETAKIQYAAALMDALNSRATYALTKLKLATEDVTFASGEFQLNMMLPQQLKLLMEQTEAARAQTLEIRSDGGAIRGLLGKQKDLYGQQITSYKRDAEIKAAKLFTDAWTVQKTMDEGLLPPTGFTNTSLDKVLTTIKINNYLDGTGAPDIEPTPVGPPPRDADDGSGSGPITPPLDDQPDPDDLVDAPPTNPSFETGVLAGWTQHPDNLSTMTVINDPAKALHGDHYLEVDGTSGANEHEIIWNDRIIELPEGLRFEIQMWCAYDQAAADQLVIVRPTLEIFGPGMSEVVGVSGAHGLGPTFNPSSTLGEWKLMQIWIDRSYGPAVKFVRVGAFVQKGNGVATDYKVRLDNLVWTLKELAP